MSDKKKWHDVLYEYKGHKVRRHNLVRIRVDEITYKELIDVGIETGLSHRKILAYSATPCNCCQNSNVTVFVNDKETKIKRGILSKRIPASFTNKKHGFENKRAVINTDTGEIFDSVKQILKFVDISYNPLLDRLNRRVDNNTPFEFYDEYLKNNPDAQSVRTGEKN